MGQSDFGKVKRARIPCPKCGAPLEWRNAAGDKDETPFGGCRACGHQNVVVFYEGAGRQRFKITDLEKKPK
jgi:ssDNA-binding Zn-finger/Zn-ribbon topoisomerase 1